MNASTLFAMPRRAAPARGGATARGRRKPGAPGFSLIELMVTVAISAILVALAGPSMTRMVRANRVQTEASAFAGDLLFARTEAIRRGQGVSVCPSQDGKTCTAANTWALGWIVFSDPGMNGAFNAGTDAVLRVTRALSKGDTFAATPAPATNAVIFNREGFTTNLGTGSVVFALHTSDNDSASTRCVSVDLGGRVTSMAFKSQSSCV